MNEILTLQFNAFCKDLIGQHHACKYETLNYLTNSNHKVLVNRNNGIQV